MIRVSAAAATGALALSACASHGMVPSASSAYAPTAMSDLASPLKTTTCAKSPPQWMWIFKGACDAFTLKSTGGDFTLGVYENITIKGSIGYNSAKGSVTVDLVDAIDKNSDIEKYKGESFIPYKGEGTTVVYAVADNQSTQTIKPVAHKGVPILKYIVSDSKGLPGKSCGAALLGEEKGGKLGWNPLPDTFPVKGDSVTITQYTVPSGLVLPPKGTGLYFAINCF
jgi:hypothetical protein